MASPFCVADVEKHLRTTSVGRRLFYKDVTGTTMDDAERGARIDGYPHGTAFVAGIQTNARGSKGRRWEAKDPGNLYASFIIHREKEQGMSEPDDSREYDIDVAGALAVLQVLRDRKVAGTAVKWMNDVVVNGHKLLGTLAEYKRPITVNNEEKLLYILGIGLNVNADVRRDDLLHPIATSILCQTGRAESREEIFAEIANHLEEYLSLDRDALLEIYDTVFTIGQEVKVYYSDASMQPSVCTFMGIRGDWSVKLADADGRCTAWSCKQVSIRRHTKHSVYVYNGRRGREWSATCLMHTFSALVNTATYEVKYLSDDQLAKGIPSDCVLLAVGELKPDCCSDDFAGTIRGFVEQGRGFMGVGTGCLAFFPQGYTGAVGTDHKIRLNSSHVVDELFYQGDEYADDNYEEEEDMDDDNDGDVKYDKIYLPSVNQMNIVDYLRQDIQSCTKGLFFNVMSYSDETDIDMEMVFEQGTQTVDKDAVYTRCVETLPGVFERLIQETQESKSEASCEISVESGEQVPINSNGSRKEIHGVPIGKDSQEGSSNTIVDSLGISIAESSVQEDKIGNIVDEMEQSSIDDNAGEVEHETHETYHAETGDDKDNTETWSEPKSGCKPDIVSFSYGSGGKGSVCLCSPNIEVTYADTDVLSGLAAEDVARLRQTVFKRDSLIQLMFQNLGL